MRELSVLVRAVPAVRQAQVVAAAVRQAQVVPVPVPVPVLRELVVLGTAERRPALLPVIAEKAS